MTCPTPPPPPPPGLPPKPEGEIRRGGLADPYAWLGPIDFTSGPLTRRQRRKLKKQWKRDQKRNPPPWPPLSAPPNPIDRSYRP